MSETLGEKLRKARENRGISISQVSEQTRIASHFLLAIEENNFSVLPGGIFNKGFVRSFAKCVGVGEQEALADYNALMAASEPEKDPDQLYTPEVLTDDKSKQSMASTVVLIVLILAVLIGGLILAIYWVTGDDDSPKPATSSSTSVKEAPQTADAAQPDATPVAETFSVEISAKEKIIEFSYESDAEKVPVKIIKPGEAPLSLQPRESFKGNFYRTVIPSVGLKLNGQEICLNKPSGPYLEVEITKDRVAELLAAKCYGDGDETAQPKEAPTNSNRPAASKPFPVRNANSTGPVGNRPAAPRTTPRN